jgi:hypothetical protein
MKHNLSRGLIRHHRWILWVSSLRSSMLEKRRTEQKVFLALHCMLQFYIKDRFPPRHIQWSTASQAGIVPAFLHP